KPKAKKGDGPDLVRFDVAGFPSSFLLMPDGRFEKHGGDRQPASCKDGIVAFQNKFDEHPIPFSSLADVRKGRDDLEKSMKASQWKQAYAALVAIDKALNGKFPKALLETAKARLATMDEKLKARVAEINKGKDAAANEKSLAALKADFAT